MKKNLFDHSVHNNHKTRFTIPTLEQVTTCFHFKGCHEKNEPEKFFYHYDSVDRHVGRNKMRSWKAAISGWIFRMEQFNKDKPTPLKNLDTSAKTDEIKLAEQQQIQRAYANQRA